MALRQVILVSLAALFVLGPANASAGTINHLPCSDAGATLPCTVGPFEFGTGASGNDSEAAVEAALALVLGTPTDIMEVDKLDGDGGDFDFDPDDITGDFSFDWWYSGSETLAFATLKSSTYFAIFDIYGQTHGTLSTAGLIVTSPGGNPKEASHVTFWTQVDVPEPSTFALVVLGLIGSGYLTRRTRKR